MPGPADEIGNAGDDLRVASRSTVTQSVDHDELPSAAPRKNLLRVTQSCTLVISGMDHQQIGIEVDELRPEVERRAGRPDSLLVDPLGGERDVL